MADSSTGGFLTPTATTLIEDADLDIVLQTLVKGACGLPGSKVRPRWLLIAEPMPEATVDWAAIGVVDETPEPYESWLHYGEGDGYTISCANRTVTIMASFYGPHARFNATMMRQALNVGQTREYLFAFNIALVTPPTGITTMSQIVNQRTYTQQDIKFDLRIREATQWPILNLLEVPFSIATERPDVQNAVTPIPPP